jgi:polar amino acid transport system permease protein
MSLRASASPPVTCSGAMYCSVPTNMPASVRLFRAGIVSVASGQRHAALALGMTRTQVLRRIILPQALMRMMPPIASTLITLVKDSSLVSVISVAELMWAAQSLASVTLRPVEVLTGTGLLYVALAYPLSLVADLVRRRYLAV